MAQKPTLKMVSADRQPRLPPELLARLERMASEHKRTLEQELAALVTLEWVRFQSKGGDGGW